ncbi:Lysosomal Pro-Xaa carboxypeptidase [Bertholletia excelsa]
MVSVLFHFSFLFLLLISSTASSHKIPRLGVLHETAFLRDFAGTKSESSSDDFKTFFYAQTLDHFNYAPGSYATFEQRYLMNSKYWGGADAKAPIFVYLGEESPIDDHPRIIGFLSENAPHFKALQVIIEHRYYGKSNPFGSMEEAMKNETSHYAEIILYLKKKLSAHDSPVIVVGASYGGMLASWFRLKYPHIAIGALASSAPILYFDNITPQDGYFSVVSKDFKEASESCYKTIRRSWSVIDRVASKANGLSILSQRFNICSHLNSSSELEDYLVSMYTGAAQYNSPPRYPVDIVCAGIDAGSQGTDVLGRIFSGIVAFRGNGSCYDLGRLGYQGETIVGWNWQTCSEMVFPIGFGGKDTMFPPQPYNLHAFVKDCKHMYGVPPRPHWITTYYGGHDIKLVLRRFASNIIFSNGLKDPWSSGGVLENLSDSLLALSTVNGSHCLDVLQTLPNDPHWLIKQRKAEVKIIDGWIRKYYHDLHAFKQ